MGVKMKKLKLFAAVAALLSGITIGSNPIQAAQVESSVSKADKELIRQGDTVSVTVGFDSYTDVKEGINAVRGTLEYDESVFQQLDSADLTTVNDWESLRYNPDNGRFTAVKRSGGTEAEQILTIHFTAKEDVKAGDTRIAVTNLEVSEGNGDLHPAGSEVALAVVAQTPQQSTSSGGNSAGESVRKPDSAAGIPLTGDRLVPVVLLTLAGGSAVTAYYIIYKNRSRRKLRSIRLMTGAAVVAAAAFTAAAGAYAFGGKGDVNGDGIVDYVDVRLLQDHLIDLELLSEEKWNAADMNSDGSLTVTDLSLLVQAAENAADYQVELTSATENFYLRKGEEAELKFTASVTPEAEIKSVVVNGTELAAEREQDSSVYTVRVNAGPEAGVRDFRITEAVLSGGRRADTDYTETVEVLKTQPAIENFRLEESKTSGDVKAVFDLSDEDGAVTSGTVSLLERSQEGDVTVIGWDVKSGGNTLEFTLEEGRLYALGFYVEYDLASGKLTGHEEDHSGRQIVILNDRGETIASQAFEDDLFDGTVEIPDDLYTKYRVQITADYDLSGTGEDVQTGKVIYEEEINALARVKVSGSTLSGEFAEKGETVTVSYIIDSNVASDIEKLVINNIDTPVSESGGNSFQAEVTVPESAGKGKITLSQVVFEDGTAVNVKVTDEIEVLRSAPSVEKIDVKDDFDNSQVHLTFEIADGDGAFVSGKAQLLKDGSVEQEHAISETGKNTVDLSVEEDKEYELKILITFERSEDGGHTVEDQPVTTIPIQLAHDYELTVSAIQTLSSSGDPDVYFEKGADIAASLEAATNTSLTASAVWVDGQKYDLTGTENNRYTFTLNGYDKSGVQTLAPEKIQMSNGKELDVTDAEDSRIEILKDAPAVKDFVSEQTDRDKLSVRFTLSDDEDTISSAALVITDENGGELLEKEISAGANEAEVELNSSRSYQAKVTASYDRDTNALGDDNNSFTNAEIFSQELTASVDVIEFKDIESAKLYRDTGNGAEEVRAIDTTGGVPSDTDSYYAVIEMKGLPDFYAGVKEFRNTENSADVTVVIDQQGVVQYDEDSSVRKNEFSFTVQGGSGETEPDEAAEFFRELSGNLKGTFRLEQDLDASGLSESEAAVLGTFAGELDGNGHRIYNLDRPLFQNLSGAQIHDLVIEDADITKQVKGILANKISGGSKITDTYIIDSRLNNTQGQTGGFAGIIENSTISGCAAVNVNIKGGDTIGGIAGQLNGTTTVTNSYVTGVLEGTGTNATLGARVGGITGWHSGKSIDHCFTKVNITAPSRLGNGGIVGGPKDSQVTINNSLSMSTGSAYRIAGFDTLKNARSVYEYEGSDSATNIKDTNSVAETSDIYSRDFYVDTLGFSEDMWSFELTEYDILPSLQGDPVPKTLDGYELEANANDIPNYSEVRENADYDKSREIAYANMAKLMPFADTAEWVNAGNRLDASDTLTTAKIRFVLPLGADNSLISAVADQSESEVQKIRIVYEDAHREEIAVQYEKQLGGVVALYEAAERGIDYQPGNYILKLDGELLDEVVSLADSYDYATVIAALTDENESRLYTDYYNEQVKPALRETIARWIGSGEAFPTYCAQPSVKKQVEAALKDETRLKKFLYAFNYYDKWYNIDFDGVTLSDLLFFSGTAIEETMTTDYLTRQVFDVGTGPRNVSSTQNFYSRVFPDLTI